MADDRHPQEPCGSSAQSDELRDRAEELFVTLEHAEVSPEDADAVLHELRVHQIELEMQNEELRRAQLELEASREKYVELFDSSPVGFLTILDTGVVSEANLTAARLLGVERQLLVGQPFSAFLSVSDRDAYYLHLRSIAKADTAQTFELRLRRVHGRDGTASQFWARFDGQVSRADDGGIVTRMSFSDIDVAKRIVDLAETRAMISTLALSATLDEVIQKTLDEAEAATGSTIGFFHFVDDDQKSLRLQTWSTNTLATQCSAEGKGSHYPVDQAGVWADCLRQRRPLIHNDYASLPDRKGQPEGHANLVRELTVPVFEGELVRAIIGVGNKPSDYGRFDVEVVTSLANEVMDIIRAKRAEEARYASDERQRFLFEQSNVGLSITDPAGEVRVNPALTEMLGYSAGELDGVTWQELTHPDDVELTQREIDRLTSGEADSARFDKRFLRKDGAVVYTDLSSAVKRDAEGHTQYLITAIIDRTEKYAIAQNLSESEAKYRAVVDRANDGIVLIQSGQIVLANSMAAEMTGYLQDELVGMDFRGFVAPARRAEAADRVARRLAGEQLSSTYETTLVRKDGSALEVEISAGVVSFEGEPADLLVVRDTTERKAAEEALAASQALLQSVVDSTSDSIYVKDFDGRYLLFNQAAELMTGKSEEEVLGNDDRFLFSADEADALMRGDRAVMDGGVVRTYEERVAKADGTIAVYSSTKGPVRDSAGVVRGLFGISRDVTEDAASEQALLESQMWLNESQRVANMGHYRFDIVNDLWECSAGLLAVFGIDGNHTRDLAGWFEIVHPLDREMMINYFTDEVIAKGQKFDREYRIARPSDGVERWVHGLGTVERDEAGHPLSMFGVIQDVTDRKQAELALAESNAILHAALDQNPVGIAIANAPDGVLRYVNDAGLNIRGEHRATVMDGVGIDEYVASWQLLDLDGRPLEPDEVPLARAIVYGETNSSEFIVRRGDDDDRIVLANAAPILDAEGTVVAGVVVFTDMTDRRKADEALRESEVRFRAVFEGAQDGIWLLSTDGDIRFVNQAMAQMHGYTVEELAELSLDELDVPMSLGDVPGRMRRLMRGEELSFELEHLRKDGSILPLEVRANSVTLGGERYVLAFHRDITDRKKAEAVIAERGTRLEALLDERERILTQLASSLASITAVVGQVVETRDPYTAGHERRVCELSVRIAEELGMAAEEISEIRTAALIHDVGKISVPAEILSKPGRLTAIEFQLIQGHSEAGHRILASADMAAPIAEMVYQHHERCDGSGYPRGLADDAILEGAKVIAVADVVEAMVSDRPYRAGLGLEPALAEIERGAGTQYDARVAEACMNVMKSGFAFSKDDENRFDSHG